MRHASKIAAKFKKDMTDKYMRGVKEHGGNVWEKPTYRYMWEELLDHVVYHAVFMDHVDQITKILEAAYNVSNAGGGYERHAALYKAVGEVLNILQTGNKEGKTVQEN